MSSGIFIRVKRNDKWGDVEFEEMSNHEQQVFLETKDPQWVISLAKLFAKMYKDKAGGMK